MEVKKVLSEDLLGRLAVKGKLPWRMMFTTFFHNPEVEDAVRLPGETVAHLAEATLQSLQRLADLPAGTPRSGWWAIRRPVLRTSRALSKARA